LPEPSRQQARRLLTALGLFWGLWGIAAWGLEHDNPFGIVAFIVAFAGGWLFFVTLYRIWGCPSSASSHPGVVSTGNAQGSC
jgi:hypothetical protein